MNTINPSHRPCSRPLSLSFTAALCTLVALFLLSTSLKAQDNVWEGRTVASGAIVNATVVDSSGVQYIGGTFATASGNTVNNIAKWNGSAWVALGSGVAGTVYAMAMDSSGNLYVGGSFTTASGTTVNRIAKWNGTAWSALSVGVNGIVRALAVSGSDLYVGGEFTRAGTAAASGGIAANKIAKLSGTAWSALSVGVNGTVNALAVSGSDLYVGGAFSRAGTTLSTGGTVVNKIAKWNGAWSALTSGAYTGLSQGGTVYALAVSWSDLYVGGLFESAGGTAVKNIAKWASNTSTWAALGSGFDGVNATVYALALNYNGELYAGGNFNLADGLTANNIARWSDGLWVDGGLGTGFGHNTGTPSVKALAVRDWTQLYVGGYFDSMDGNAEIYSAALCVLHERAAGETTKEAVGVGELNHLIYINPWGLSKVTGVTARNCTMTVKAYGPLLDPAGIPMTANGGILAVGGQWLLPAGTTNVTVEATMNGVNTDATANAGAYDSTGGNAVQFDPVMDILTIGANGEVRKAYTDIISAEHYVRVANRSPGLDRVNLMVNGRTFEIGALAPGQAVVLDVGSAMNEGDQNTIVALAYGAPGTRADIQIYDTAVGTPIKLTSRVVPPALRVIRAGNQLVITWQAPANFFNLESKTGLTAASLWKAVSATQTGADGMTTVTIDLAEGQTLFRLQQ